MKLRIIVIKIINRFHDTISYIQSDIGLDIILIKNLFHCGILKLIKKCC